MTQRYLTRSVPRISSESNIENFEYYNNITNFREFYGDISEANYFEFGAGWDLLSNIIMYYYGVPRQFVIDITPLAKPELINHAIECIKTTNTGTALKKLDQSLGDNWRKDLLDLYGIRYEAPADARETNLPSGSIDLIGSAHTFEHIPWSDLKQIMRECARLCNKHSILSIHINYADHYCNIDPRISPYNFLRYSYKGWRKYNPPNQFHNRKRHVDFVKLFQETGFDIIKEERRTPDDGEKILESLPIAEEFSNYTMDELLPTSGRFVLKKHS